MKKLGYKVNVTVLAPAAFLQAASQGDSTIETSINFPQSQVPFRASRSSSRWSATGSIIGGGMNGYMVDKKTAKPTRS